MKDILTKNESLYFAIEKLIGFSDGSDLIRRISKIEKDLVKHGGSSVPEYLNDHEIGKDVLQSALLLKHTVGQINVIIHVLGMAHLLEKILEDDEVIEELSMGAGNTNKHFDLTTNKRIAEFKFINWTGKQEAIRQNSVFKDFFELCSYKTDKKKFLYVLDKKIVLKFFNNNRALKSVLSKNETTRRDFYNLHGDKYTVVSEYYKDNKDEVNIVEIRDLDAELFASYRS